MRIVEKITEVVREKSERYKAEDAAGYDFWANHIRYVYDEATKLAEKYGADIEIVQLGALLHDIALIDRVGTKVDHHENGRKIADEILTAQGYPEERKERVLNCVLHHRSSKNAENIEEICVCDADVLAHFDNIPMLISAAIKAGLKSPEEIREFLKGAFEKDFNDLSEKTRPGFEERYRMIIEVVLR